MADAATPKEELWKVYQVVNEWIRFSDTKAVAILTVDGLLATLAFGAVAADRVAVRSNFLLLGVLFVAIVALGVSVYFSIKCIAPTSRIGTSDSLIFYGHLAVKFHTAADYLARAVVEFSDPDSAVKQIGHQVWANSRVALNKFNAVNKAIWALSTALGFSSIAVVIVLFS